MARQPASGRTTKNGRRRRAMSEEKEVSRRWVLVGIGVLLNGAVALLIATPIVGYLLGPVRKNGGYDSCAEFGWRAQHPRCDWRGLWHPTPHSTRRHGLIPLRPR